MFEPAALSPGPSGLADSPRPFVFRSLHLDGQTYAPGESFYFDLNLFDTGSSALQHLVLAFSQLARDGLGPARSKVELTRVAHLNERGEESVAASTPLALDLDVSAHPIHRLRVQFLTPTELKSGQQIVLQPDFGVLAARARDRISTLRELYGGGALTIDFRAFGERAALVKMTRCDIKEVAARRRSSRTGQVHSIGGFVGEAEYEGDLSEFFPYLQVAKWTGVGRQTVWGKGHIESVTLSTVTKS